MSILIMSRVWKYAPVKGNELIVLLAMADWANDDGESIYPSYQTLADKCRISRRQVIRIVKSLKDDGFISRKRNAGEHGQNTYKINLQSLAGDKLSPLAASDNLSPSDIGVTSASDIGVTQSTNDPPEKVGRKEVGPEAAAVIDDLKSIPHFFISDDVRAAVDADADLCASIIRYWRHDDPGRRGWETPAAILHSRITSRQAPPSRYDAAPELPEVASRPTASAHMTLEEAWSEILANAGIDVHDPYGRMWAKVPVIDDDPGLWVELPGELSRQKATVKRVVAEAIALGYPLSGPQFAEVL